MSKIAIIMAVEKKVVGVMMLCAKGLIKTFSWMERKSRPNNVRQEECEVRFDGRNRKMRLG